MMKKIILVIIVMMVVSLIGGVGLYEVADKLTPNMWILLPFLGNIITIGVGTRTLLITRSWYLGDRLANCYATLTAMALGGFLLLSLIVLILPYLPQILFPDIGLDLIKSYKAKFLETNFQKKFTEVNLVIAIVVYILFVFHDIITIRSLKNQSKSNELESRKDRTEEWHKWVNVPTVAVLGMLFVFTARVNIVELPKAIVFANGAITFQLFFAVLAFLIMFHRTEKFFNFIKYFGLKE